MEEKEDVKAGCETDVRSGGAEEAADSWDVRNFVPLVDADLALLESVVGRRIRYDMASLSDTDLMARAVLAGEEYMRLRAEQRRRDTLEPAHG